MTFLRQYFTETLRRMLTTHRAFLTALDSGIVPAGEEATTILHDADAYDNLALIDTLRIISQRYPAADFNITLLRTHIAHDIAVLEEMVVLVQPITPDRDAKLTQLRTLLNTHAHHRKVLLFTQYADTARYLFRQLNPERRDPSIEVIYSNDRDKARIVARFSPSSNRELQLRPSDSPIQLLIATDVLSEGLNLQDCDTIVNYDLHWNPVRLIQRFGRIDRIGTEYTTIYGVNFLPERALERNLGLYEVLCRRIREIHETIGEDTAVLEPSEALNEQAMYAIYSGDQSVDLEEELDDSMIGLNEAEELLRQLRTDNPEEYERIAQLRNGIRSGRDSTTKGRMIFCQAGQYQQLLLVDESGSIVSRDIAQILKILRCTKDELTIPLDSRHNSVVSHTKSMFAHEAAQRRIEQQHTVSLTNAIRRAELIGLSLVQELGRLFTRYHLDQQRSQPQREDEVAWPYIVCSEMLV